MVALGPEIWLQLPLVLPRGGVMFKYLFNLWPSFVAGGCVKWWLL